MGSFIFKLRILLLELLFLEQIVKLEWVLVKILSEQHRLVMVKLRKFSVESQAFMNEW